MLKFVDYLKMRLGEILPFIPDFLNNLKFRFVNDPTQFGEKKFLESLPESGNFLEIGAYMPHVYSNSWVLQSKGKKWNGISIDPYPGLKVYWSIFRPRSKFIAKALVTGNLEESSKVQMKIFPRRFGVLSTILPDFNTHLPAQLRHVDAITLDQLTDVLQKVFGSIDLLMIDVEGYDTRIIEEIFQLPDFPKPSYILAEDHAGTLESSLSPYGFKLLDRMGPSVVFHSQIP